jgi:hypothetical protein
MAQTRKHGSVEPPLITAGGELVEIGRFSGRGERRTQHHT